VRNWYRVKFVSSGSVEPCLCLIGFWMICCVTFTPVSATTTPYMSSSSWIPPEYSSLQEDSHVLEKLWLIPSPIFRNNNKEGIRYINAILGCSHKNIFGKGRFNADHESCKNELHTNHDFHCSSSRDLVIGQWSDLVLTRSLWIGEQAVTWTWWAHSRGLWEKSVEGKHMQRWLLSWMGKRWSIL